MQHKELRLHFVCCSVLMLLAAQSADASVIKVSIKADAILCGASCPDGSLEEFAQDTGLDPLNFSFPVSIRLRLNSKQAGLPIPPEEEVGIYGGNIFVGDATFTVGKFRYSDQVTFEMLTASCGYSGGDVGTDPVGQFLFMHVPPGPDDRNRGWASLSSCTFRNHGVPLPLADMTLGALVRGPLEPFDGDLGPHLAANEIAVLPPGKIWQLLGGRVFSIAVVPEPDTLALLGLGLAGLGLSRRRQPR